MNVINVEGSNVSHCATVYEWSPDSRYFMTATLAPRMNVDNGFKIFKYSGTGPILQRNLVYSIFFSSIQLSKFISTQGKGF